MKLSCHEHVEGTCFFVDLNLLGEYFSIIVYFIFIIGLICYWPGNKFSNFRLYILHWFHCNHRWQQCECSYKETLKSHWIS